ncbi:hypothetical protein [Phytohabitans flavus]|uniref:tetratricopeptide repeat protein n=1 Tax=Phytohabitans flavus TaxID=1076124 RepID=UPI0031E519E7
MTGCLLYAQRGPEIDEVLPVWRHLWAETNAVEQAHRQQEGGQGSAPPAASSPPTTAVDAPEPAEVVGVARSPHSEGLVRRRALPLRAMTAAAVVVLIMGLVGANAPAARPHMTGLYNIVLAPFTWSGPTPASQVPSRLQTVLFRELNAWADEVSAIQLRGPDQVEVIEPERGSNRNESLHRVARDHGADVVVTGRLQSIDGMLTVEIELFLTDRTFGDAPEFVGLHTISVTEPVDVLERNLEINEELTETAVHYLKAVVAFVRGLGDYALDDFTGAEGRFLTAEAEFDLVDEVPGHHRVRHDVLYLLLGNTVGRGDKARLDQAVDYYRLALSQNPSYTRARIGLAEATRAAVRCQAGQAQPGPLELAADHYRAALAGDDGDDGSQAFLRMQAHLGLGLAYQCLTIAKLGDHWADADAEFREVLRLHATGGLAGGEARHSLRLAAEAKAGQALTAYLTAGQSDAARYGGYQTAAAAYEEALALLDRIDVVRPRNLERELIYLRNLRSVYQAMDAPELTDVDARISATSSTLASVAKRR